MAVKILYVLPDPPTVTELIITDTAHDGWEAANNVWSTSGYFGTNIAPIGALGGSGVWLSLHYESVALNRNTHLESATLTMHIETVVLSPGTVRVRGELIANASLPANVTNLPSDMTTTANYTDIPGSAISTLDSDVTVDVTSIINEILAQSGWVNGNAINLIVENVDSPNNNYAGIAMINRAGANGTPLRLVGG